MVKRRAPATLQRVAAVAAWIAAGSALAACGTQYSDPIRELQPSTTTPPSDPCSEWTTESTCNADTAHGCSFQPNVVGCSPTDASCAPGVCRGGDPFVRRSGETLWLHGAPYSFVGTVSWGIAWGEFCTVLSQPDQEQAIRRTFDDLVAMRASVLKIWAFQSYAGASGTDYSRFELVVDAARRAGVRLIFVLENHWGDCTRGFARDDAFYAGGYAEPYGGYALSLPDYARGLASHFREEPTILAWELMHEARSEEFAPLDAFARDLSQVVRDADPNHLIALGTDNGDSPGTSRDGEPPYYQLLHDHPHIDLIDVHDFGEEDVPLPTGPAEARAIAGTLKKPIFAGATAVDLTEVTSAAFRERADKVERKLEAATEAGFAGFLLYDYYPDWENPSRVFDGRAEEPLAGPEGVIARHAPDNR